MTPDQIRALVSEYTSAAVALDKAMAKLESAAFETSAIAPTLPETMGKVRSNFQSQHLRWIQKRFLKVANLVEKGGTEVPPEEFQLKPKK